MFAEKTLQRRAVAADRFVVRHYHCRFKAVEKAREPVAAVERQLTEDLYRPSQQESIDCFLARVCLELLHFIDRSRDLCLRHALGVARQQAVYFAAGVDHGRLDFE